MGRTKNLHIQMQEHLIAQIERAEEGEISILDAVIALREERAFHEQMISDIKAFEDEKKDQIEQEAVQYQNQYKGATFEFRSGGKTFDFKGIDEWKIAHENLKEIEEKYKSAWENSQKGNMSVTEDGEVLELPKINYRKGSMIVKLPNK